MKNDGPLERDIEADVRKYAVQKGFYSRKFVSPSQRGVPDRIFISPNGVLLFVEFKRRNRAPTLLQIHELKELERYGQNVFVIDSKQQGRKLIDDFLTL